MKVVVNIVNKHTHTPTDRDVYIGRGSPVGNLYTHLTGRTSAKYQVKTREEAVEKFENGNCDITVLSALHPQFFECTEED